MEDERGAIPAFPCNEPLSIDRALLRIDTAGSPNLALFAVNKDCYRCTATLLLNTTSSNTHPDSACANLWTAHAWDLTLRSSQSGALLASLEAQRFGEHGEYNITFNPSSGTIDVVTVQSPDDPNTPLYILLGVLAASTLAAFVVYPAALEWTRSAVPSRRADKFEPPPSVAHEGHAEANAELSAPLLSPASAPLPASASATPAPAPAAAAAKKHPRVDCIDTLRGICLCLMIFVNYGGGHYWFFEHSAWNGMTVADVLFPWFVWLMGVSMALSMGSVYAEGSAWPLWRRVLKRSCTLIGLGLFLSNGYNVTAASHHWRLPGVLQYFGISYLLVSATMLLARDKTRALLRAASVASAAAESSSFFSSSFSSSSSVNSVPSSASLPLPPPLLLKSSGAGGQASLWAKVRAWGSRQLACAGLSSYRHEWPIQAGLLLAYVLVCTLAAAPGCPAGYVGPGGIGDEGRFPSCTGGVHRFIDEAVFGFEHYYHSPTCKQLYNCVAYDPEGLFGSISATTLTYLGLTTGRVLVHFRQPEERAVRWVGGGLMLCFVAGMLCGFTQDGGWIPVNKNLWSTSFVLLTAGSAMLALTITYFVVDVWKVWTGAPLRFLGLNSIFIYCAHGVLGVYFPFSYSLEGGYSHASVLLMNVVGTSCWVAIAYYCFCIRFFVKI